jgi:dTDP-4-dehydrorhamnose 3,5-epimerase-like enzyme
MNPPDNWIGVQPATRKALIARVYDSLPIEQRLGTSGMDAAHVLSQERVLRDAGAWIPGVELFHRHVHPQRQRGLFAEFAREGEGVLGRIGLWPRQWSAARMFAGAAKGFHIHPPFVPKGTEPAEWLRSLFVDEPDDISRRPYDREQWDVMFFVQGRAEMLLIDERAGLSRTRMRLFIDGDDCRSPNNAALVIPPGVAHAIRAEGSIDIIMVYGTTTVFNPDAEGRIASGVESASLPAEWASYWDGTAAEQGF